MAADGDGDRRPVGGIGHHRPVGIADLETLEHRGAEALVDPDRYGDGTAFFVARNPVDDDGILLVGGGDGGIGVLVGRLRDGIIGLLEEGDPLKLHVFVRAVGRHEEIPVVIGAVLVAGIADKGTGQALSGAPVAGGHLIEAYLLYPLILLEPDPEVDSLTADGLIGHRDVAGAPVFDPDVHGLGGIAEHKGDGPALIGRIMGGGLAELDFIGARCQAGDLGGTAHSLPVVRALEPIIVDVGRIEAANLAVALAGGGRNDVQAVLVHSLLAHLLAPFPRDVIVGGGGAVGGGDHKVDLIDSVRQRSFPADQAVLAVDLRQRIVGFDDQLVFFRGIVEAFPGEGIRLGAGSGVFIIFAGILPGISVDRDLNVVAHIDGGGEDRGRHQAYGQDQGQAYSPTFVDVAHKKRPPSFVSRRRS